MTWTDAPPVERRPVAGGRCGTSTILTAVALGAAVGVVLIPLNFVQGAITATMPLLAVALYGVWGMSSLIPLALQRRPGVGIIGGAAAGVVSSISPYGLAMVVMMLAWGVLMELPFTLSRYRHFGRTALLVAGVATGVVSTGMSIGMLDLTTLAPAMFVAVCLTQVASFVACAWASYLVAGALRRAGVSGGRRS